MRPSTQTAQNGNVAVRLISNRWGTDDEKTSNQSVAVHQNHRRRIIVLHTYMYVAASSKVQKHA